MTCREKKVDVEDQVLSGLGGLGALLKFKKKYYGLGGMGALLKFKKKILRKHPCR